MQIQVNGNHRDTKAGTTVADLLCELNIKPDRVAVEVNLEILDKGVFAQRCLQEGDRVEIISFIGGGARKSSAISFQRKTAAGFFRKLRADG